MDALEQIKKEHPKQEILTEASGQKVSYYEVLKVLNSFI